MSRGKLELVIFDCDGVLVNSEPIANQVLMEHLRDLNLPHTADECDNAYRGLSMASMIAKIEEQFKCQLPADFEFELQKRTYAAFRRSLQAIPGVEDVIKYLRNSRIPICVASSGSQEKMDLTLGLTGLKHYFAANIFSATEVEMGKPAPDLFLLAAQLMGVAPSEAIVIEDSIPGVQAALAAQIPVVACCHSPDDERRVLSMSEFCEPNVCIVRDMNEVLSILKSNYINRPANFRNLS